ncbi:hypothetical protein BRD03_09130 [Halobacteriales archaeon QS_9_68_17]|nr:MAG: hypothetical protein BRD03_09130 [Halobacteriales archaeon QS_9_68_17]
MNVPSVDDVDDGPEYRSEEDLNREASLKNGTIGGVGTPTDRTRSGRTNATWTLRTSAPNIAL